MSARRAGGLCILIVTKERRGVESGVRRLTYVARRERELLILMQGGTLQGLSLGVCARPLRALCDYCATPLGSQIIIGIK